MKVTEIPLARLAAQAVSRPLASPVAVVRHLLATQAQDYAGAKWAVALRVAKPVGDPALERRRARAAERFAEFVGLEANVTHATLSAARGNRAGPR